MYARLLLFLLSAATLGAAPDPAAVKSGALLANGDFEKLASPQQAQGWPAGADITVQEEAGNHFLRLKSPRPGAKVLVYQAVSLAPGVQALRLSYKGKRGANHL